MPQLPVPPGLRLCDPDFGREETRVCITFDLVLDATVYDVRLDGATVIAGFAPGSNLTGLPPNTAIAIEVRARANGFQDSDWSAPIIVTTRPPVPAPTSRVPVDLQGWGITLRWSEPGGWNDSTAAHTQLQRDDGAGPAIIFESPELSGRFTDTSYPPTGLKAYSIRIVVDSASLGALNISRDSIGTIVRGAINSVAPTTVTSPLHNGIQAARRLGSRLIGLKK